ncbi:MAG: adenylate/guanylate cyclase domain-containing protein [Thermoanaerobaculia bacterium]
MRLNLRSKLVLFAIVLAILPLLVAGQRLTRIARDELKSAANEDLAATARQVSETIDSTYQQVWLAPLTLVRNAIDDQRLGVEQKIALLTQGITDLADIAALQVTIEGAAAPVVVSQQSFYRRLEAASLNPLEVLRLTDEQVSAYRARDPNRVAAVAHVPETDDWLATVALPLSDPSGRAATLLARIDLRRLRSLIEGHTFQHRGEITIVDRAGERVFAPSPADLSARSIVTRALRLLGSQSRAVTVEPYARPDGSVHLGAVSFPRAIDWAVLVEMSQHDAYLAVGKMIRSLLLWIAIGLLVAAVGAVVFALRMSRPILAIGEAAVEVGKGNFKTRVTTVRTRDEIGELAGRINDMIAQLGERFQLLKFVSGGTLDAIREARGEGIRLGGESVHVTALFADIRGYTAFAEGHDPGVVVDVLNHYFQSLADLVVAHHGDIDKFVGDQIMAVFRGGEMAGNAVACALEFQRAMVGLGEQYPNADLEIGVGINAGEVVMGAMGSRERMDYTVLGDNVNLAARLCAHAGAGQILASDSVYAAARHVDSFAFEALEPIRVKGKSQPIPVYAVRGTTGPDNRGAGESAG